jgi:hypothetical protein
MRVLIYGYATLRRSLRSCVSGFMADKGARRVLYWARLLVVAVLSRLVGAVRAADDL